MSPPPKTVEILLVDDDEADVLLTSQMLKRGKLSLNVTVAHDGEEALEKLHALIDQGASLPDMIMLDINMPRMDGFETLQKIRQTDLLKALPIIMLTTSDAPQDVKRVYELGANCYISKPVTFEQFQNAITLLKEFWFNVAKLPES